MTVCMVGGEEMVVVGGVPTDEGVEADVVAVALLRAGVDQAVLQD